jgi:uncharacterized protein YraI
MQRKHLVPAFLALALAAVILLSGCGAASGPQATPVPPTKTPKPTFTPTTVSVPTRLIIPTATSPANAIPAKALATATPEATAEPPTATPQQAAQFTADQGMNVRSGPGTNYPTIGQLKAGDSYKIMAKNQDDSWVQFNYEGDPGWANSGLLTIAGDIESIKVAQNIPAAPTPRPVVVQQPAPKPAQPAPAPQPAQPAQPAQPQYPFQLMENSANCQPNEGTTYFNGVVRYRSNALHNGVCVHIAFYGPRQTKCSGCGGVGDGNWGFSPFGGGKAPKGTTVEIYVVSCQGVPATGQTEATGFADLTPKSPKWTHTLNGGEQCTGITFVGD